VIALETVHAVVVNWSGGGPQNLACVESLLAQGIAPERVHFVDNASTDGSRELVEAAHPTLAFLRNDANLGFGEGANQGARAALAAGAEAVFFVNNDLTLPAGSLTELIAGLERHPQAGMVGPRVLQAADPSVVWCAGGELSWRQNLSTLRGNGMRDGDEFRRELQMDYLPGCALLVTRACWEAVGSFDAGYFAYMEDVDLGVRGSALGFESWLIGAVAAHHASSSATGGGYNPRRKYMMGVNSIWFLRAHGGPAAWLRFFVFDVLSLPFVWLANLPRGQSRAVLAKAHGILAGLAGKRVRASDLEPGGTWLW
jgi:GT2 family glycosyltransferase